MRKRPRTAEFAGEREDKLRIGKLRLDAAPGLAARFELNAVPTLIIFAAGEEKKLIVEQQLACGAGTRTARYREIESRLLPLCGVQLAISVRAPRLRG